LLSVRLDYPIAEWLRRLHKFPHVSRIEQFQLRLPALFLWLANCYFDGDSLEFPALLPFWDAPSGRSFSFIGTLARLLGHGSVLSIVANSFLKDQLLNVNHFQQRCMKTRPDTPISLYDSNRLCFID
jgi:hypothetical protein